MISRINSPYQLGRLNQIAKRKGGDVTPWYLAGGISPADCVAAYQPKGAASYAASKVNLANPETNDLSDGGGSAMPFWTDSDGWYFDGIDDILFATDYHQADVPFSIIARVKPIITHNNSSAIFSLSRSLTGTPNWRGYSFKAQQWQWTGKVGYTAFGVADDDSGIWTRKVGYTAFGVADDDSGIWTPATDVIIALTRNGTALKYFVDGSTANHTVATNLDSSISGFQIGCSYQPHNAPMDYLDLAKGNFYALAFYHKELSAIEISALTTAMNAL